ncbi:hypothetical protein M9Y10_018774 [Tritrichomonas musculus]|uniref:E2F/DP family winged-helix DNA-binding domain-containing protein n=1 Tax=Tritrichomonas musculus TaxID=1915356 RepID=A0ABR2HHQ9_9EUKA
MSQNTEKEKKTLVTLTQDFLNVLTSSEGKEVDLSQLENELGVSKRRLYDVTNVLAGIGVVERSGKAKVKWIGNSTNNAYESEIQQILQRESETDRMLKFVGDELDSILLSQEFNDYGWVTIEDILTLAPDSNLSLFSLKGPKDLTIENPEDEDGSHHLICQSENGGINLVHVNPKK